MSMRPWFLGAFVAVTMVGTFDAANGGFRDELGLHAKEGAEMSEQGETGFNGVAKQRRHLEVSEDFLPGEDQPGSPQSSETTAPLFNVTEDNYFVDLVALLPEEGIIYCPISKVASAEWKRVLRWIVGVPAWESRSFLHMFVRNGLKPLSDWGFLNSLEALRSERFFSFVVIRDPAERLVSAFLNKCVSENFVKSVRCPYLTYVPHLFPGIERESAQSTRRFKEMIATDPENTLFEFTAGMLNWVKANGGDPCLVNTHYMPQACFCDLQETLPAYYVMQFSNLSTEAAFFADKLPARLSTSMDAENGMAGYEEGAPATWDTGVNETRREEIRKFTTARFAQPQDTNVKITDAADRKASFLSERTMAVVREFYKSDYELFRQYFSSEYTP
ncbi:unnamed protein product [Scytosiphon promiscuus]